MSSGSGDPKGEVGALNRRHDVSGRPEVDFRRPPVIETILGVQFAPLRGLTLPYIGLYWGTVRDRYPTQEVKPPLAPVVEDFTHPPSPAQPRIQLSSEPDARCWFIDRTSTQLIQVQRNRFIRNWRKGSPPHDQYPRYETLKPEFERDWLSFVHFLEREDLGVPDVNQCEVTYINHIELGVGWERFSEAHKVLSVLKAHDHRAFLPEAETLAVTARYLMPEGRGRLHVASQPAIRRVDGRQVMQLTLTARGKPGSSRLEDIATWFNDGHEWIIHGFVDLTTPAMHTMWGRQ